MDQEFEIEYDVVHQLIESINDKEKSQLDLEEAKKGKIKLSTAGKQLLIKNYLRNLNTGPCLFRLDGHYIGTQTVQIKLTCITKECRKAVLNIGTEALVTAYMLGQPITASLQPAAKKFSKFDVEKIHSMAPPQVLQIRGEERRRLQRELETKSVEKLVQEQCIQFNEFSSDTSQNSLLAIGTVVAQKVRSQMLAQQDEDKDPLVDVVKIKIKTDDQHNRIINSVGYYPVTVVLIPIDDLIKIKKTIDVQTTVLEFDASGLFCKNPYAEPKLKANFLYSGVIKLKANARSSTETFHLVSMISTSHDQITIGKLFAEFKLTCVSHQVWPLFQHIVSDWSYANINGIMIGLNNIELKEYLVYVDQVSDGLIVPNDKIIDLSLCSTHLTKTLQKDVRNLKELSSDAKFDLVRIFTALTETTNKLATFTLLEHILILLSSKLLDQAGLLSREFVNAHCANVDPPTNFQAEEELIEIQFEEPDQSEENCPNYLASPFYQKSMKVRDEIDLKKLQENVETVANPLFSLEFREVLIRKYAPYLPLICPWMYAIRNGSFFRFNSARIEGAWHRYRDNMKQQQMSIGAAPVKMGRFISKIWDPMNKTALTFYLNGLDKSKTQFLKKNAPITLPSESWKKKSERKAKPRAFFDGRPITSHLIKDEVGNVVVSSQFSHNKDAVVLDNFCVSNPNHYGSAKLDAKIARVQFNGVEHLLLAEGFNSLQKSTYLNSDALLYVGYNELSKATTKRYKIVHPSDGAIIFVTKLFQNRSRDWNGWKILEGKNDLIFFPIKVVVNHSGHWVLIVVRPKSRKISIIDPLKPAATRRATDDLEKVKENFGSFVKEINKTRKEKFLATYTVEKPMPNLPTQTDSFNCGIYVILFMKMYSSNYELDCPISDLRNNFAEYCLQTSLSMAIFCLICSQNFKEDGDLVSCCYCRRAMHVTCCKSEDDDIKCYMCVQQNYSGMFSNKKRNNI